MEKPIYPLKNMRITQGYEEGTHIDSFAVDDAGLDTGIESIYAPFTGTIKKIYTQDANEVWLESNKPVEYPDGTIDYMTILFAHANNIDDLYVGKQIKQKEIFYQEGTSGNATGNHCHIECGRGKYEEPGWIENNNGYYVIINGRAPEDCLWIDEDTNIIDNYGYQFRKLSEDIEKLESGPEEETTVDEDNSPTEENQTIEENQSIEQEENIRLIYTCTKDDLYGIYLKEGEQVYIKKTISTKK